MGKKLTILDQDGVITSKIHFNYPDPANDEQRAINTQKIKDESRLTVFAKYWLRFIRGDKHLITGRKESVLGELTRLEIIKLYGYLIPITFYYENGTYDRESYHQFKIYEIEFASIGYTEIDIYDDDLPLCIAIYQALVSSDKRITIYHIPDASKLKRIKLTEAYVDEFIKIAMLGAQDQDVRDNDEYEYEIIRAFIEAPNKDGLNYIGLVLDQIHSEKEKFETESEDESGEYEPFEEETAELMINESFEGFYSIFKKAHPEIINKKDFIARAYYTKVRGAYLDELDFS